MREVSVAEAKARLSELIVAAEAGEEVVITRRGQAVARLSGVMRPKQAIDFAAIDAIRNSMPKLRTASSELVRKMRDGEICLPPRRRTRFR